MKVPAFVFRFRYAIHSVIYVLGFWAPWNMALHLDPRGPNAHVWGILAANLAQLGVGSLLTAFNILLVAAILCAVAGAWLRTWGGAYLGADVVKSGTMHSGIRTDGILTDGPFGHVRNPLYIGTFLHTLALALLMPRSGAIFTIAAIGLMQLALIAGEETFLTAKLGAPYEAYCALVPRLFPSLKRKAAAAGLAPRWGQAFAGEIYFWVVAFAFTVLGWEYNAARLVQSVIVAFGLAVVVRALTPKS